MSAYIVVKEHVAYLTAMAMGESGAHYSGGLEWYFGKNGSGHVRRDDLESVARAASMLWRENMVSVAYRYGDPVAGLPGARYVENGVTPEDVAAQADTPFNAVQVLKSCNCLEYQSCEHPGWEDSEAHAFLQALKEKAIRALPGYETARWGVPVATDEKAGRALSDQPDSSKCPVCGSPHIEGGFVEICGIEASQALSCTVCGASWDEVYTFTRRDNIEV